MNDLIILKTNLIGGVEKQQIIDYITDLQAQLKELDLSPEIKAAEIKICTLNEEISGKESTLIELRIKLEQMTSFEAKLEAALDFIQAMPEKHFKIIFQNINARNAFERLNSLLSVNTYSADNILSKINAINGELQKISSDLQSVLTKLDDVPFNERTEIASSNNTNTDSPAQDNEFIIVNDINTDYDPATEFPEADDNDIQPKIFPKDENTSENQVLVEDEYERTEPALENSVDNFFAELEKLMNK